MFLALIWTAQYSVSSGASRLPRHELRLRALSGSAWAPASGRRVTLRGISPRDPLLGETLLRGDFPETPSWGKLIPISPRDPLLGETLIRGISPRDPLRGGNVAPRHFPERPPPGETLLRGDFPERPPPGGNVAPRRFPRETPSGGTLLRGDFPDPLREKRPSSASCTTTPAGNDPTQSPTTTRARAVPKRTPTT